MVQIRSNFNVLLFYYAVNLFATESYLARKQDHHIVKVLSFACIALS